MNIITSDDLKKIKDFVELYEQYECTKRISNDNIYILEELILKQQKELIRILSGRVDTCECCNEKCNCCDEFGESEGNPIIVQCENCLTIDLSQARYVIVQENRQKFCHLFIDGNRIDRVQSLCYEINAGFIPSLDLTLY